MRYPLYFPKETSVCKWGTFDAAKHIKGERGVLYNFLVEERTNFVSLTETCSSSLDPRSLSRVKAAAMPYPHLFCNV